MPGRSGPYIKAIPAAVLDWVARVQTNGGAKPSTATINAMATFWNTVIGAGLDTKAIAVNCYVPDNLIASITPLIVGGGNDPWTNHNFVSGDLTTNGLSSDGSTKYLDSGLNASTKLNATSNSVIIYYFTGAGVIDFGAQDAGLNGIVFSSQGGGNGFYDCYNPTVGAGRNTWVHNNLGGYYCGSRRANNDDDVYFANSTNAHASLNHIATSGGARPNLLIFVHCMNNNGVPYWFQAFAQRLSFVWIGLGLTTAESLTMFNAVQALRTTLGGAI